MEVYYKRNQFSGFIFGWGKENRTYIYAILVKLYR